MSVPDVFTRYVLISSRAFTNNPTSRGIRKSEMSVLSVRQESSRTQRDKLLANPVPLDRCLKQVLQHVHGAKR